LKNCECKSLPISFALINSFRVCAVRDSLGSLFEPLNPVHLCCRLRIYIECKS